MLIRTSTSVVASGKVGKVEYKKTANGCPILTFSLKCAKDPNDTKKSIFLNCKCFYEKAKAYRYLTDGMEIMVCGEKQVREYNGKTYEDCLVDLICMGLQFAVVDDDSGDDDNDYESAQSQSQSQSQSNNNQNSGELKELSQDELDVLPF